MAESQAGNPSGQVAAAPAQSGTSPAAAPAGSQPGGGTGQPTPQGTIEQPGTGSPAQIEGGRGVNEGFYQTKYQELKAGYDALTAQMAERTVEAQPAAGQPAQAEPVQPAPAQPEQPAQPDLAPVQGQQGQIEAFINDPNVQQWTDYINTQVGQYDHLGAVADGLRQRARDQALATMQQRSPRLHAAYVQVFGLQRPMQQQQGMTPKQIETIVDRRNAIASREQNQNEAKFYKSMGRVDAVFGGVDGGKFLDAEILVPNWENPGSPDLRMSRRDALNYMGQQRDQTGRPTHLDARRTLLEIDPGGVFNALAQLARAKALDELRDAQISGQLDPGRYLENLAQQQERAAPTAATQRAKAIGIPTERRTQ